MRAMNTSLVSNSPFVWFWGGGSFCFVVCEFQVDNVPPSTTNEAQLMTEIILATL